MYEKSFLLVFQIGDNDESLIPDPMPLLLLNLSPSSLMVAFPSKCSVQSELVNTVTSTEELFLEAPNLAYLNYLIQSSTIFLDLRLNSKYFDHDA